MSAPSDGPVGPEAGPETGPEAGVDIVGRHSRLVRRTLWISLLTLTSRVLGFVREILAAFLFGDRSAVYDAFITAWRIPNLFRRFLGEGAMSTALQQAITRADGDHGEAAGRRVFVRTLGLVSWALLALCALVMLAAHFLPDRMPLTGFAWLGEDPEPIRVLTVRLMPFVIFICISALIGGALQVRGHFTTPNLAPIVLNVGWITTLVLVARRYGWVGGEGTGTEVMARHMGMAEMLVWGVLVAGVLQVAIQVPALFRRGLLPSKNMQPTSPGTRVAGEGEGRAWDVIKRSAPLAFGAAVYQINVMIDGFMAESLLPTGGPTAYYYANRVQQFPLALISIAATSAVFPALTALGHKGDRPALRSLHDRTQRAVAFVALPASIGLFALAGEVVSVCFEHGSFGSEGVARTSAALRALTLAILPAGAVGLVARTYYALDDYRWPVRASVYALVANVILNLAFLLGLGLDVEGLALATALTSWGQLVLLTRGFRPRLALPASKERLAGGLVRMAAASLAAGLGARGVFLAAREGLGAPGALGVAILAGMGLYWLIARGLGLPEARGPRKALRSR